MIKIIHDEVGKCSMFKCALCLEILSHKKFLSVLHLILYVSDISHMFAIIVPSLVIKATDNNNQNVTTTLDITVSDLNDNDPAFSEAVYVIFTFYF